jgi:DNA-binding response OmpR family regulator
LNKKILIVDDEPNILMSLEYLMKKEGFDVDVATDGDAALAKAASFHPDLMLLDVTMPKRNGFEVCEALRADAGHDALKIVLLTARGGDSDIAKGSGIGADAYVTKPFSTKDLVTRVKSMLNGA